MLRILYLVHDLSDPAVRRRLIMFEAGGAHVTLVGFRRKSITEQDLAERRPVDLGMTRDGRFAQRIAAVARAGLTMRSRLRTVPRPDLIIARNLEMLALAERAKAMFGGEAVPVVYECLDIHRLVLRDDPVGWAMRGIERRLARGIKLLLTSSPAFPRNYFIPFGQISSPVELIENKHFEAEDVAADRGGTGRRQASSGFRIGWFGALRCRRSLQLLASFTRRSNGRYEVVLRGRPALAAIPDFHQIVESEPHLSFKGPYRNPEDMRAVYDDVHFTWAIDFYEEGQNSEWLLPNRLYEGCNFGSVPIAMKASETGRFLGDKRIGVLLSEPTVDGLATALEHMDEARYGRLHRDVAAIDRAAWRYDRADCRRLVERLGSLAPLASRPETPAFA